MPALALPGADPELEIGAVVGEYEVLSLLGQGGFGRVYKAKHRLIGKIAAVKVLSRQHSSNAQAVLRFVTEARAVNQIKHPNIVDIFSFGVLPDERRFLVMELLEGVTLDLLLYYEGILQPGVAITILEGIGNALDAANEVGIIHRDIKPENIFVLLDGKRVTGAKLLDFGIAKLNNEESAHQTKTGVVLGTPRYMSPEQARGRLLDRRSDLYSLGVVAFEMLTGRTPFENLDPVELTVAQTSGEPPRPSSICPSLALRVDAPVLAMLSREPELRPASAKEAVASLEVALFPERRVADALLSNEIPRNTDRKPSGKRRAPTQNSTMAAPRPVTSSRPSLQEPPGTGRTKSDAFLSSEQPKGPGRTLPLIAGVAVCSLGGVLLLGLGKTPAEPKNPASGLASLVPSQVAPAQVAPSSPATDAPSAASATPSAAASSEVEVIVQGAPAGAIVRVAGRLLGEVPGPFKLARGDAALSLVISADGYRSSTVTLVPTSNAVLSVQLPRQVAPGGGLKTPKELDNPFAK